MGELGFSQRILISGTEFDISLEKTPNRCEPLEQMGFCTSVKYLLSSNYTFPVLPVNTNTFSLSCKYFNIIQVLPDADGGAGVGQLVPPHYDAPELSIFGPFLILPFFWFLFLPCIIWYIFSLIFHYFHNLS